MKLIIPANAIPALALGALLLATASCSVSEQRQEGGKFPVTSTIAPPPPPSQRQQLKAVRTFAKTTFRLVALDEAQLAGLDVQPRGAALPAGQLSQLKAAAGRTDNVPLRLRLRLEARNPGRDKVLLNQLEYVVLVDSREVASGSTDDGLEIGPRSTLSIPLTINADVREALTTGLTAEALASALGTWNHKPARFSVQVRPTFQNAAGRAFRTTDFEPIEASVAGK